MNTDTVPDLTNLKNTRFLYKAETEQIIGCAFDVLNKVGHGLHEKIYENALTVAFRRRGIGYDQQRRFPVLYEGVVIGEFIPDLVVNNTIVVDPKVIDQIGDHERGKMLNYLRISMPCWFASEFQEATFGVGTSFR